MADKLITLENLETYKTNEETKSDAKYQQKLTTTDVQDGTIDKVIGFDSQGNIVKGSVGGGGGTQIDGGYNFKAVDYTMHSNVNYLYLGICKSYYYFEPSSEFNKYGWHNGINSGGTTEDGSDLATQEKCSLIILTSIGSSSDFVSITQNALYLYDGTAINNHASLQNAIGKLCYLKSDCIIEYSD